MPAPPTGPDLDATLGFEGYVRESEEVARGRFAVTDAVRQPFGIVHGGAMAALAESVTSHATYETVGPESIPLGMANATQFLRPVEEGWIEAVGRVRHRGRTTWVWDVELSDSEGRLCALCRMTIAVRPMPGR